MVHHQPVPDEQHEHGADSRGNETSTLIKPVPADGLADEGGDEGAGNAGLDTPAIASIGVAYQVTPDWTVTVQGNWYEWSRFEEIRVTSPGLPDLVNAQNYKDSYSFAAGVEYRINPEWTWRAQVIGALTLVYLLGALLHHSLAAPRVDQSDPVARSYWNLIRTRSAWMPGNN